MNYKKCIFVRKKQLLYTSSTIEVYNFIDKKLMMTKRERYTVSNDNSDKSGTCTVHLLESQETRTTLRL